jgi:poly(3-hydroxybutyrate) depolymerase
MDYQASLTRFAESAFNTEYIAVFPNGLKIDGERCWQGAPYCTTGVSDKVFVTDLLNYMRQNYCVADNKVYASGKSIGGGFVDVLACSSAHGGDFAAFAMDAAALYTEADGSTCSPARKPLPILELHGTNDQTAEYNGGRSHGAPLPPIRDVLNRWAVRNGCQSPPVPIVDRLRSDKVFYTQFDCGGLKSSVVGYNVTGQSHVWISTQYNEDNKGATAPIDASTIMMEFFKANPKP